MARFTPFMAMTAALALSACSTVTPVDQDTSPIVGPAPRFNTTPMAAALACLKAQPGRDLRIGVSDIVDGTGVMEGGSQNSRALSQRPDMMMVVALAASGAHLVNRSSVNVAEWELNKAMEKKLGDGRSQLVEQQRVAFRPIRAGVLLGSTHYVTGAITELNWNLDSSTAEAGAFSVAVGKRTYRISIAVDIVVTDTQTTEIVHAKSYKKQLVGFETNANLFRFVSRDSALKVLSLGNAGAAAATQALEVFQANLGEKQNEPTQTALRWVIELAAFDLMKTLRRSGGQCDTLLPVESLEVDPVFAAQAALGGPTAARAQYIAEAAPTANYSVAEAGPAPAASAVSAAKPVPARAEPAISPAPAPQPVTIARAEPAPAVRRAEAPTPVAQTSAAPAVERRRVRDEQPKVEARPEPKVAERKAVERRSVERKEPEQKPAQRQAAREAPRESRPQVAQAEAAETRAAPVASGPKWMSGGVRALGTDLSAGQAWASVEQ